MRVVRNLLTAGTLAGCVACGKTLTNPRLDAGSDAHDVADAPPPRDAYGQDGPTARDARVDGDLETGIDAGGTREADTDTGARSADSSVPACPTSCTLDSECQTQCPAVADSLMTCCDQVQSKCFVNGADFCPDQEKNCPSQCTSDSQCQSNCPASPSGTPLCCDSQTSTCAPSSSSSCPSPTSCNNAFGCESDMDCTTFCPAAPDGFVDCCYEALGRCYLAQGPCPE